MTSSVVKAYAEQIVRTVVPNAPFQDTIGVLWKVKDLPEVWSTIEYSDAINQRLTVGPKAIWREQGSFTVVLVGKSGFGVDALQRMGESVTDLLQDKQQRLIEDRGISGMFRFDSVGLPNPDQFEDGNWILCEIVCVYTYDSVRGAVHP